PAWAAAAPAPRPEAPTPRRGATQTAAEAFTTAIGIHARAASISQVRKSARFPASAEVGGPAWLCAWPWTINPSRTAGLAGPVGSRKPISSARAIEIGRPINTAGPVGPRPQYLLAAAPAEIGALITRADVGLPIFLSQLGIVVLHATAMTRIV